ncbi:MAG: hypothetical protein L0191_01640 [Acidobacteria bacterium]|nr:hypothetical protein [Acidobacteriota bacterium]
MIVVAGLGPLEAFLRKLGVGGWLAAEGIDGSTYVSILTTLAEIAGVFLGLYFTAVSIVASTVYARVPGDVRSVLTQEKVGNVYIRTVALLAAVATLMLVARATGYQPGLLHLVLVSLLGLIAIFSFVVLGTRAFNFFDPTSLVDYLAHDLARWIRGPTPRGFEWRNPSFQAHYQRQAERALETYRNIFTLAISEEHLRGRAVMALAGRALGLLQAYEEEKLRIPTDSHWFARRQQHRDWFTTDYSEVAIALQTGTGLLPQVAPDPNWFEAHIQEMVVRAFRTLREREDLGNAQMLCDALQRTLDRLGFHFAVDEGLQLFGALGPEIRHVARAGDLPTSDPEWVGPRLAVVDTYGMGLISLLLGLSRRLSRMTEQRLRDTIDQIRWSKQRDVYRTDMPRIVVERLEHLQKGLEFEREVEGRIISPRWYQVQIAATGLAQFIASITNKLVDQLDSSFAKEAELLMSEGRHILASQVIQRGLEACEKFRFHLPEIRSCFDRLSAFRRVPDIPWPAVAWEDVQRRVGDVRERLLLAFAQLSINLAALPRAPELPDYFGHAYAVLAQESYAAMATGKEELFKKLFPPFFLAGLTAHDLIRGRLKGYDDKTKVVFSTEPIADLLELSGYAIIYSELDGKGFWDTVKRLWDAYFEKIPDPQAASRFVSAVVEYRRSLFAILPRDLARTSWKQDLEHRLHDRGLLVEPFERRYLREGEEPAHPSVIVRALVRGGPLTVDDPQDVFIVVYLAKRPEAAGLAVSASAESFARSLEREEARMEPSGEEIL